MMAGGRGDRARLERFWMGINRESDVAASLMIGPTSEGMVRIYVESEGVEIPMDFEPDEALEIAEELRAAAETARNSGKGSATHRDGGGGPKGRPRGKRDAGR
jgi:hypothetical protein